jgi:hypothetical protein
MALATAEGHADHERFIVGEMRNVDPSATNITSTSGACVPSHDRARLDCDFTASGLWQSRSAADMEKEFEQGLQEFRKTPPRK